MHWGATNLAISPCKCLMAKKSHGTQSPLQFTNCFSGWHCSQFFTVLGRYLHRFCSTILLKIKINKSSGKLSLSMQYNDSGAACSARVPELGKTTITLGCCRFFLLIPVKNEVLPVLPPMALHHVRPNQAGIESSCNKLYVYKITFAPPYNSLNCPNRPKISPNSNFVS